MSSAVNLVKKPASVVLLSGGLDSSANLAIEAEIGILASAIHIDYGQRAEKSEWKASQELARYYGVSIEKLQLPWLGMLGGSSLTDSTQDIPELRQNQLDEMKMITESAKKVWVPNRNGILINVAAAFAERVGAKRVLVGFNREEATTFPDNSQAFLEQATRALSYSTANGVEVYCHTTALDKREIVEKLKALKKRFPHELVWSCYHSGEKPCGRCESCGRHDRALTQAGVRI